MNLWCARSQQQPLGKISSSSFHHLSISNKGQAKIPKLKRRILKGRLHKKRAKFSDKSLGMIQTPESRFESPNSNWVCSSEIVTFHKCVVLYKLHNHKTLLPNFFQYHFMFSKRLMISRLLLPLYPKRK